MADVANLPLAHELVERAESLLVGRDPVGEVVLVEVDVLHPQTPKGRVDRLADIRARSTSLRPVTHVAAELRRQQHAIAPPFEHLAEQLLAAAAVAVDVGGVEERDSLLEGRVHDRTGFFEADAAAEVVTAEADDRDFGPTFPQVAHTHGRGW